ncbi:MAG TPA: DUF1289 domain-containing protein [Candidatus Binatia bacterium]
MRLCQAFRDHPLRLRNPPAHAEAERALVSQRHPGERDLSPHPAASPCVGICTLRAGSDLCEGCLRTIAEISEWAGAGEKRRIEILAEVSRRRAREGSTAETAAVRPAASGQKR